MVETGPNRFGMVELFGWVKSGWTWCTRLTPLTFELVQFCPRPVVFEDPITQFLEKGTD